MCICIYKYINKYKYMYVYIFTQGVAPASERRGPEPQPFDPYRGYSRMWTRTSLGSYGTGVPHL